MGNGEVSTQLLKIAAAETTTSGFSEITPFHLLIALSRLSEEKTEGGADEHVTALRQEFESLGIEPRRFRRRLRALLPKQSDSPPSTSIHRSQSTKDVYKLAQLLAQTSGEESSPSHLLRAMFLFLADALVIDQSGHGGLANGPAVDEIPKEL
jgi:hypothetical protein